MVKTLPLGAVRRALKSSRNEIMEFRRYRYGITRWNSLRQVIAVGGFPSSLARFR